jgi:hypothetical protein
MAQDLVDSGVLRQTVRLAVPFANVLSSSLGGTTTQPIVIRGRSHRRRHHPALQ